uniref:Mnd1 HTH domain-containing protein n=1 Tax=Cucumis melo TaxID=3656 RepID=A0A9I9DA45_CUCME
MLQIFYESQDFFLLKELEKLGPRKGVISQSVKDVVQSLVDDDLVSKEKIGTSVYFWSLPSCAGNQEEREEALAELKAIELKHKELKKMQLMMLMLQPTDGQVGMTEDFDYLELSPTPLSSVID